MEDDMVMRSALAPRVVIGAGDRRLAVGFDPEGAGHAEMHDEHLAAVEIGEQIFGPPAEADNTVALQPLREIRREGGAQVRPPDIDLLDAHALHDGGKAEAYGFDFGKFGHPAPSIVWQGAGR